MQYKATNETPKDYAPGSDERVELTEALNLQLNAESDIYCRINGEKVATDKIDACWAPDNRRHKLATFHSAGAAEADAAINAAREAKKAWSRTPLEDRALIFLRAAELLAGPRRQQLNAATMLGQGKTVFQAEIDSACEMIDFLRFNVDFALQLQNNQPNSSLGVHNQTVYRPLDGFVFAVTPFNFTAIAGNLCTAPAIMGNTVVWKPSERAVLSAHYLMDLLEEAGLPPGVINMIPSSSPAVVGDVILEHPDLAGLHFTGSTGTFQHLWRRVGENISTYNAYPRIVGETGGKDFVFAHETADVAALVTALIRGAFEYQGQKCSAASRAYIPDSLFDDVAERLTAAVGAIKQGPVTDYENFMSAVIDERAYEEIKAFIDFAREDPEHEIIAGGACDDEEGYFIEPTVVVSSNPTSKLMTTEIFGPVLTIYRYPNDQLLQTAALVDQATKYALTGAIFARDRTIIRQLSDALRFSAGNFYINDKPTGAVVGQQPFGGGRKSGTNDKAGSLLNLTRWTSPQTVKETFAPPTDYRYPHMGS